MANEVSRDSQRRFDDFAQIQALIYVAIDGNNGEYLPVSQRCQLRGTFMDTHGASNFLEYYNSA